ncbi:MAG: hypothetical protein NT045_01580 [Candidatus Aureabacteria bacterium]|nr:hypothetical protein [Candidatus Auribacterota bacterium]
MPLTIFLPPPRILILSLLLLSTAVLFHVRRMRRRIEAIDIDSLQRRIAALEARSEEHEGAIDIARKDAAEAKIKARALEGGLAQVQEESSRFLNIFKTVLYGFDYIVQGCKNAIELNPGDQRPPERRIGPE